MIIEDNPSDLFKNLQLLAKTNNIEVTTIEHVLNPAIPRKTLDDPNFHRLILGVAENVLALSQFENFNEIFRFYLSMDSTISQAAIVQKSVSRLADAFFTCIKNKPESEVPYDNLLIVYDNIIESLVQTKDFQRLMYISNSLLSLGSRCRQAKIPGNVFLDYWRRSVSIELDLEDKKLEKSSLLLKSERLCLALSELGYAEEAFEIVSDSLGFYANRNGTVNKVRTEHLAKVWEGNDIQRILNVVSRLLMDTHPKVSVAFSNLNPEVEASVLECLLELLAKSSRPNKVDVIVELVQRIQAIISLDEYPLRNLRVLYSFFKSTGISYEKYSEGITSNLLGRVTEGEFAQDQGLVYSTASIVSLTSLSLVVSSSVPLNEHFMYLNMSVQYMIEALNSRSNFSESLVDDAELLSYFLDLQGAHEKRAELLRGVIRSLFYKDHKQLFTSHFHLQLISSLLSLGFTGAAVTELETVKKSVASLSLKPVEQVWLALRNADCCIAVSDLPNAGLALKKICSLIEADELLKMPLLAGRPASEDRAHFQNRATLFAEICYTLAKLHIEEVCPPSIISVVLLTKIGKCGVWSQPCTESNKISTRVPQKISRCCSSRF